MQIAVVAAEGKAQPQLAATLGTLILEMRITLMQMNGMEAEKKISPPGITVRFPNHVRQRVDEAARFERRSAASYIEALVERDLRARDEAARVLQRHVSAGLPDIPEGEITRQDGESDIDYVHRAAVLNALFGA